MSLLLTNGLIHRTAHDSEPAQAILLKDEQVAWIGPAGEAPAAEQVVDLEGRVAIPALTDAHVHIFMLALAQLQLSFARNPVTDIAGIVEKLSKLSPEAEPGGWLQGCVLMEERLDERRLPTRHDLDNAFPNHPVLLRRYCGHVAVMNSAAMRALGLALDTPDPDAGAFGRDAEGALNGIAEEAAAEWVFARAPAPSDEAIAEKMIEVMQECLALGITAANEAAVGFSLGFDREAAVWALLRERWPVPLRMGFMSMLDPDEAAGRSLAPSQDRDWRWATLKFFADGIIGGRTGAVSVPYEDTGGTGYLMHPPGVLEDAFVRTHAGGWRIAVHATGDVAIQRVADAIIAAQSSDTSRRHRIEHCFVPPAGIFATLAAQGINVVMQPGFLTRMGGSIARGLGPRTEHAYPAASVLAAGGGLAFSSDAPTGPLSPWQGIADAVTRRGHHGDLVGSGEAVSVREALHAYLHGGAHAMGDETWRGALEPGMAGDVAVLDRDPFQIDEALLPDTRSVLTVRGGRILRSELG